MALAVVRDLREVRAPAGPEELAAFETDVLAGFVLARASAGLSDGTISSRRQPPGAGPGLVRPAVVGHGARRRGRLLRQGAARRGRAGPGCARAQALKTYFAFVELRHKVEIHQLTGRVVECPIDEMNRPRGRQQARLRIPPAAEEVGAAVRRVARGAGDLPQVRARRPATTPAARLMAEVGLRVNEVRRLDLADVKWDLGRFGKLHVRHGKGARGSGPRERMVPLINGAGTDAALVRRGRVGPVR